MRDTRTEKEQLAQENADLRAKLDSEPYPNEPVDEQRSGIFHR